MSRFLPLPWHRSSRWRASRPAQAAKVGAPLLLLLLVALAHAEASPETATEADRPSTSVAVYGPDGGQILLDGRLAGRLPLPVPLAVSAGKHQLRMEQGRQVVDVKIDAKPHRPLEVRFTLLPPLAVVTPTFGAVLFADYGDVAAPAEQALARAVLAGAAAERILVLPPQDLAAPLAATPGLSECLRTLACQERLANLVEAHFVLLLRIVAPPKEAGGDKRPGSGTWRFAVTLHDVPAGETSATATGECAHCTLQAASQRLGDMVSQVVRDGSTRPEGALEVTAVPNAAKVVLDGRDRGSAPLRQPSLAGQHEVLVEAPGYFAQRTVVTVTNEQTARLLVTLVPIPSSRSAPLSPVSELAPPPGTAQVPPPAPVPWLRQPGKWVVAGLGIGELLAAATLWSLDGSQSCPKADTGHCHFELDSRNTGIGLLIGGGATLGVSGLLFYLDARSAHRPVRTDRSVRSIALREVRK